MNDLRIYEVPQIIERNFPTGLQRDLEILPLEAQNEFLSRYGHEMKALGIAYILHILFAASYLYEGKWFKQILFWLTGCGFVVGWFINMFRLPGMIRRTNMKIARRIVNELRQRYGITRKSAPARDARYFINERTRQIYASPRNIRPPYDPVQIDLEQLQTGFMVDYDLKTWDVACEYQYDWFGGKSEREFVLTQDMERLHLVMKKEGDINVLFRFEPVNIYAIDSRIVNEISLRNRPGNILNFNGITFYRETQTEGVIFNISEKTPGQKVCAWEYLDQHRNLALRIERRGKADYRALTGMVVSELEFSDILPRKEFQK